MHYYEVAPCQVFRFNESFLTYSSQNEIKVGQIVVIEIGSKQVAGVVYKEVNQPSYKTKSITKEIINAVLPKQSIDLAVWISSYYATPLAITLQLFIPRGIQINRRSKYKPPILTNRKRTKIVLNSKQLSVIDELSHYESGSFLLNGVTGSGKTEIYIDSAKKALANNRSVIILVPEIALTPQLLSDLSRHFSNLLTTSSDMTEAERHDVWLQSLNSSEPTVIIGPRSALFAPLKDIGLIVVDEAHENSYKQEKSPKYSALRVATILGQLHQAKVIFGSATPSVADTYLAEHSDKPILYLDSSAKHNRTPARVVLIDMKDRKKFSKHRFFSDKLIDEVSTSLNNKKQILLFHNRRGSAAQSICKDCGWVPLCPNCHIPLSLHADKHLMLCHVCGHKSKVATSCPSCKSVDIIHKGIGTKLIETEIRRLFPEARVARLDSDRSKQQSTHELYDDIYSGKIDIIIGTQIIAKGLDLPNLELVGVIQADSGLALPDYTTNERVYQLISQVIGRVGRDQRKTTAIIQTYQPKHPSITDGIKQDYSSFYLTSLEERRRAHFPPFSYLMKLTCQYTTEEAAINNALKLSKKLTSSLDKSVKVLRPTPSFYERLGGRYRWHIILKSPRREYLVNAIKLVPKNNWQFELDPSSLL